MAYDNKVGETCSLLFTFICKYLCGRPKIMSTPTADCWCSHFSQTLASRNIQKIFFLRLMKNVNNTERIVGIRNKNTLCDCFSLQFYRRSGFNSIFLSHSMNDLQMIQTIQVHIDAFCRIIASHKHNADPKIEKKIAKFRGSRQVLLLANVY